MKITFANKEDLAEILALQYRAYQSEAELLDCYDIQPLTQSLAELEAEYQPMTILKAVDEQGVIVGSVRGYQKEDTLFIGKLMVEPKRQSQGIGKDLIRAIEDKFPASRYELFTSALSERNLHFYRTAGYQEFKREELPPGLTFVYFEKQRVDKS